MFERLGGQTVMFGNFRSEMERVEIEVVTGCFCHSKYDLLMRTLAPRNPKQTKENHKNLTVLAWYCLKSRFEAGEFKTLMLPFKLTVHI